MTAKMILPLFLLCAMLPLKALTPAQEVTPTGAPAPELELYSWPKGEAVKLADIKGKKAAVLFFWTPDQQSASVFPLMARLAEQYKNEVAFIGIGVDSAKVIGSFFRLKELPFPVASDDLLKCMNRYLRERDRAPVAVIIDKNGILAWRGKVEGAAVLLDEVIAGKYDVKAAIEREAFSEKVMGAMHAKDYDKVLDLLDKELVRYPGNFELLSLKVKLLAQVKDKLDDAMKAIEEAVKADPKRWQYYELAVSVLKEANRHRELAAWYDRIIREFGDQPMLLVKQALQEMNQPVGELRLENALKLCRAAYASPKFANDQEKGAIAVEYARAVYYCGRPDKALELSKEALTLLKGTPDFEKAKSYVTFYGTVMLLSKQIQ